MATKTTTPVPLDGVSEVTITRWYHRFNVPQRVEHIVLLVSFSLLAITGLPQKFVGNPIAEWIIQVFGGIEAVRVIHRISAIVFVLLCVYHVLVVAYKTYVRRTEMTMLPGLKDATDALDVLRYNLFLTREHPKLPRFTFAEKMEYYAMVWGAVLMGVTGFMLWNPVIVARFLPGSLIPAAKAAHGAEAILAVLAIIIWHFYGVHIKTFNRSIFNGKLTRHQMEMEHGAELEQIEAGQTRPAPSPADIKRRERIFIPVALVLGLAGLFGVLWFATFEETAIATLPAPVSPVPAFAPVTRTPAPSATVDNAAIGAPIPHPVSGQEACLTCHAAGAMKPFPTGHEGRPVESCLICHREGPTPTPGPSGEVGSPAVIPHPIDEPAYADCTVCHGLGKLKPFPDNHAAFAPGSCTACHQPAAPAGPTEPAASPEAAATGAPAGSPAAIPHPIDGPAYADCTLCHGPGKLKPNPENHAAFAPGSCTACHQPAAPAGTTEPPASPEAGATGAPAGSPAAIPHPIDGPAYADCTLCHGPGKLKPNPENHAAFAPGSCTACHQPAAPAETTVPEAATPEPTLPVED
jgi:cytochrome b subunit of formate dehydrogenase